MNVNFFLVLIAAYILGSIPPSVWVSRIFYKRDIRAEGSKNAGLTNAANSCLVTLLEASKNEAVERRKVRLESSEFWREATPL